MDAYLPGVETFKWQEAVCGCAVHGSFSIWQRTVPIESVASVAYRRQDVLWNASHLSDRAICASLVRSILVTSSVVWISSEKKYNFMLEQVQKQCLRYLYKKRHGYSTLFGFSSLQLRRYLGLTKFVVNIIRLKIDSAYLLQLLLRPNACRIYRCCVP